MTKKFGWLFCVAILVATGFAYADKPDSATLKVAAQQADDNCSRCHGDPGGDSIAPMFPRLAGQSEQYIENQLKAFKARKRVDTGANKFMLDVAASLDDQMIKGLAYYYSSLPPVAGQLGDPVLTARGKELFEKGIPSKSVPACAACHGVNGEGVGEFPRLAGQHAVYIERQLMAIQTIVRDSPIMHGIVKDLNKDEVRVVATYLESR